MNARKVLAVLGVLVLVGAWAPAVPLLQGIAFLVSIVLVCYVATAPLQAARDRVLASALAVVLVLMALGFLLHLSPWGLTRRSWAVAWGLVVLGVAAFDDGAQVIRFRRVVDGPLLRWGAASLVVIGAAIGVAWQASASDRATPLTLSVVAASADEIRLLVDGPSNRTDLSLVQIDGASHQTMAAVDLSSRHHFEVVVPKPLVRVSIELVDGAGAMQRSIIVDPALAAAPKIS
jgi:hypothetical protein